MGYSLHVIRKTAKVQLKIENNFVNLITFDLYFLIPGNAVTTLTEENDGKVILLDEPTSATRV